MLAHAQRQERGDKRNRHEHEDGRIGYRHIEAADMDLVEALDGDLLGGVWAGRQIALPQPSRFISLADRITLSRPAPAPRKKKISRNNGTVPSQRSSSQPIPPPTTKAAISSTPARKAKPMA